MEREYKREGVRTSTIVFLVIYSALLAGGFKDVLDRKNDKINKMANHICSFELSRRRVESGKILKVNIGEIILVCQAK